MDSKAYRIRFVIDGVEYKYNGGPGFVMESYERGVRRGECRMICGVMFHAWRVSYGFLWNEIDWVPVEKVNYDWINKFVQSII